MAELPSAPAFGLQHALLLQGPAGPFMKRFARELRAHGVAVTKVNFHAGDELFFPPWVAGVDVVAYRGDRPEWPGFVRRLIEERAVDGVFVFPDTNAYGAGENPTWLYTVAFTAQELWGESGDPQHAVIERLRPAASLERIRELIEGEREPREALAIL